MMKKFSFLIVLFSIFLTSCQAIKDGLSGSKSENSDEFLVQKKNPLVMPPEFMKLPKPKEDINDQDDPSLLEEKTNIENILSLETSSKIKTTSGGSAETFVLDQINK